MRVFVAGATGAVGRRLLPLLVDAGHQVVGTTRSAEKSDQLRRAGAEPVVVDALDSEGVRTAVAAAQPDVVIDELTALSRPLDPRRFDEWIAETNRLRIEGTDHLLAAAKQAGARRFLAQSITGWTNPRTGSLIKTEDDPLDPEPVPIAGDALAAVAHLEDAVITATGIEGVVLRYGLLYGPGTALSPGGPIVDLVQRRRYPVAGRGTGVTSWVHVDDAAAATALAVGRGAPGLYNIVDDDPAPAREWLPHLASVLGAKPPWRLPLWLARPLMGDFAVSSLTDTRGSSNAKAKRELGWVLHYPSWREGFATGL